MGGGGCDRSAFRTISAVSLRVQKMPSDWRVGTYVRECSNYHVSFRAMLFCCPLSTVTLPAVDGWSYPSCLSIGWSCRAVTVLVFMKLAVSTDAPFLRPVRVTITEHITHCLLRVRPPLWSSGQSFWLQIRRSRVRFPAQPDFLSSSGSGTGSTQPREVN